MSEENIDQHPAIPGLTAARRKWIYGVVLACAPLAVVLGLTDNETAALVVAVIAAVLGGGVALPNVDQ